MPPRMLPEPTPETRHFWEGCKAGELRLQRCIDCDGASYFPPRPFCPNCGGRKVETYKASGEGVLWSYVINMRPRPDMGTEPYAIAVVKLSEGPQMMTNIVGCPQTPEALQLDMPVKVTFAPQNEDISLPFFEPAELEAMKPKSIAVVGAAETTQMGKIPYVSVIGLHADAALNALADCGLKPSDIDGVATAGISPADLAHYMGIRPTYADGTSVGGCSFMLHVRHAAAAINEGLCTTVLITHGESGRSRVGAGGFGRSASSLAGQFEMPFGPMGPPTMFTIPVLRYLKARGYAVEDLAQVAVIQREWAAKNPRASFKDPISIEDVLKSDMIAWPFTKLMCCLVTDGGGALILTSAERAKDFPQKPVYVLGTGESVETPMVSQMYDFTSSTAFRISGKKAFDEAGIKHSDVDHLMIYDAFAHLPLYGLEDLGFCKPGEAAGFIRDRNTAIGGKLPLNTNGGGLSYMHSGMYGMYALQESVRQMRGVAPAQVANAKISIAHGVGGMFAASGTIVFSNEAP